ncbi:MAG: AsmA family protein, partial [Acetobacteraceae bacterium]
MAERRRRRGGFAGRRGLRVAALVLAGLFALLLGVLWFAPRFTDWNRHRAAVAAVVGAALGRPVTLSGPITLSLLPQTQLRAGGITVADIGDGVGITARAVRLRVALRPLLAGRVVMRTLFLDRPTVTLPWPLPPNGIAAISPAWLSDLSARIESGTLVIGGLRLTGVNARLAAGGGAGALSASGTAKFAGRGWSFLLTLAEPDRAGQSALNLRVNEAARAGAAAPIGLGFGGTVSPEGEVRGQLVLQGGDLGALLPVPALPFDLRGRLVASARAVTMKKAAVALGGVSGSAGLRLAIAPRLGLAVSLALPRLVLAPWLARWTRHPSGAALVPTRLTFSIGRAAVAEGALAGLRGRLRWGAGGLSVTSLAAGLPGGAQVSFAGVARAGPRGHGRLRLLSPALGATADWLARALGDTWPALPRGLAGRAVLSSRLRLAPGRVMLTRLAGTLGGSRIGGGLSLALGARPRVAAGLRFDRLSLDPWRATVRAARAAFAGVGSRFGFDLELRVGQLTVGGWRIDHLL